MNKTKINFFSILIMIAFLMMVLMFAVLSLFQDKSIKECYTYRIDANNSMNEWEMRFAIQYTYMKKCIENKQDCKLSTVVIKTTHKDLNNITLEFNDPENRTAKMTFPCDKWIEVKK